MLTLDPGPLAIVDAAQLAPLPPSPGFAALVTSAVEQFNAHADALHGLSTDVSAPVPVDVDAAYASTIDAARTQAANEADAAPGSPVGALVTNGDNADAIRNGVRALLPQPDLPITGNFIDPPRPPGGQLPDLEGEIAATRALVNPPGQTAQNPETPPPITLPSGTVFDMDLPGGGGDVAAVREAIRQVYLALLNREPDPGGWDAWTDWVINQQKSVNWVYNQITLSDEYKAMHSGVA